MTALTPAAIARDPNILTRDLTLPTGEKAILRVALTTDSEPLGRYFVGLSAATRNLYAPHAFDMQTAARICSTLDYADSLRFVLVAGAPDDPRIIAYIIVKLGTNPGDRQRYANRGTNLDEATTCSLAPSVADAYQSRGIGSAMMPSIFETVRCLGYRHMVLSGGTRAINHRAIRFYEKQGFRKVGDFVSGGDIDNHDMILEL